VTLTKDRDWQSWVLPMLLDVPKEGRNPKENRCYAYVLNVFSSVHVSYFMSSTDFFPEFCKSLDSVYHFAGFSKDSQDLTCLFMYSLVCQVIGFKHRFRAKDFASVEWANVLRLLQVARKFVFQTEYWRDGGPRGQDDEALVAAKRQSAKEAAQKQRLLALGEAQKSKGAILTDSRDARITRKQFSFAMREVTLLDNGLHFNDDGQAADYPLVEKIIDFFDQFDFTSLDPAELTNASEAQKAFRQSIANEYRFWREGQAVIKVADEWKVGVGKPFTYRKISHLVQRLLSSDANTSAAARFEFEQLCAQKTAV